MLSPLVDIGLNLGHKSFAKDRQDVLSRAVDAGVQRMILTGTSVHGSQQAQELAATHPGVLFSTAGVHPHDAKTCDDDTIAQLRTLSALPEVVAIGECGLDFNRDFSPRDVQEQWFTKQIELACECELPLFLHERDAHDRFASILASFPQLPPAVVHCFTGSQEQLDAYLDAGYFIGITGWICDERRGGPLREIVGRIPLDQLMIETDAPFLTPRDLRPKPKRGRNEPMFLPHILRSLAECMGHEPETLAQATSQNAHRFFRLPSQAPKT